MMQDLICIETNDLLLKQFKHFIDKSLKKFKFKTLAIQEKRLNIQSFDVKIESFILLLRLIFIKFKLKRLSFLMAK